MWQFISKTVRMEMVSRSNGTWYGTDMVRVHTARHDKSIFRWGTRHDTHVGRVGLRILRTRALKTWYD